MPRKISPVHGMRLKPMSPESIAASIEDAWAQLKDRPRRVSITQRGRVIVGTDSDRYPTAVEVGVFSRAIGLADLRAEIYHVWESMQR